MHLLQAQHQGQPFSPVHTKILKNPFHSANLLPMPGAWGDPSNRMPFRMTQSSLGFIFIDIEHVLPVPNFIINQVLQQAIGSVGPALARDPSLRDRPVRDEFLKWTHPIEKIALYIEPAIPKMTHGNLFAVLHQLRAWAAQYEAEQCSFQIWGFPGTERQVQLGMGHFMMDPNPPVKSEKRGS